jgi:hypothetical protein
LRLSLRTSIVTLFCLATATSFAQTLAGTITNGTIKKPAAGDEVVLIKLASGMEEAARTKTDAQGKFSFKLDDAGSPHLIRAIHQDVTYHKMAPPGTTSVDLDVFDVVKKLDGVGVTADVMRIQSDGSQLETIRLFAVNNASDPPRTQMNDHNFEFYLPEGAKIVQSMARTANGQPINSEAIPQKERNKYAFNFPLRPGETQFQIAYQLPYSGSATIQPKSAYPVEHFVVMVPKAMQFTADAGTQFQSMQDPQQSDANVQVAQAVGVNQPLGFKISGTGSINLDGTNGASGSENTSAGGGMSTRGGPGGGLGPPIDAPDPLQKYRWWILAGFAAVLLIGAYYVSASKGRVASAGAADLDSASPASSPLARVDAPVIPQARVARPAAAAASTPATAAAMPIPQVSVAPSAPVVAPPVSASGAGQPIILQALKEEIFQLELEHKQGHISQAEYDKAKAALDATLERALKREAQKA